MGRGDRSEEVRARSGSRGDLDAEDVAEEMRKRLASSATAKDWSKYKQVERLQDVSQRVDVLWDFVLERMELAESEAQRDLDFFGTFSLAPTGNGVGRAEIERKLADPSSAYRRLRRIMDAWCALWFWPLTETEIEPPSIDQWIDALTRLLGRSHGQQDHLVPSASAWEELERAGRSGPAPERRRANREGARGTSLAEGH